MGSCVHNFGNRGPNIAILKRDGNMISRHVKDSGVRFGLDVIEFGIWVTCLNCYRNWL